MKCLIVSDSPSSGGLLTFLNNIIRVNNSFSFQTTILISDDTSNEFISKINSSNVEIKYYPAISKKLNVYNRFLKEVLIIKKIISNINPGFIIVNTGNPTYFFSLYVLKYPLIYVVHSLVMKLSWKAIAIVLIPKIFSSTKKIILTVSFNSRDRIIKFWHINIDYIKVVYNPFNLINVKPVSRFNRERIILTIGHVIDYKNPKLWLKVAESIVEQYDDVIFCWVGDGPELCHFQELTKDNSRINFVGYNSDVLNYYKKAYLYLQPSISESQGIAVVEAMANGIPCIVSNAGGLPEVVKDGITGFVCENQFIAYISCIRLGLNLSRSKYEAMSKVSIDFANKFFDTDGFNLRISEIYKGLI